MLINKDNSILLIVDVQERLSPIIENSREVINGAKKLVEIANELGVLSIVAEQYTKGLGETIFDVREVYKGKYFEKNCFSCAKNEAILKEIKKTKKKQVVISGIETHICVLQTAMDLKKHGYEVFVVADACGSRDLYDTSLAFQRMSQNAIEIVSVEMVAFEWLEGADNPSFKAVQKKII